MFATTADGLLAFFRAEVADAEEPYLWEDWEAYGYMTEGFHALLSQGDVRYETIVLDFEEGEPVVDLPARVLHIREAHIVDGGVVNQYNANDGRYPGTPDYGRPVQPDLFSTSTGTPCVFVRDYENSGLRLVPTPNADGQLEIQCTVSPVQAMANGVALPTTDATDLRLVLHFMKHLAYRKQDAETEEMGRANYHEGEYNRGVLEREQRLRNQRRSPGAVRMQGW